LSHLNPNGDQKCLLTRDFSSVLTAKQVLSERIDLDKDYYHCTRQIDHNCKEPYISEEELERSLLKLINFMYIAHPQELVLTDKIQKGLEEFKRMREALFLQQDINPNSKVWDIRDYSKYILANKNAEEKRELFNLFQFPLFIQNSTITSLRAH